MKLLFIDHECHAKTGSSGFFLDVLRKAFDVETLRYSRHYATGAEKAAGGFDIALAWEFPVSRSRFFFPGIRNVFVPMYDNEWGSRWQWRRIAWSGEGVVSFCGRVSEHAARCGVKNILDVRYFPDPASLPQMPGDPRKVFLWERGDVSPDFAKRLFPPELGYSFDVKRAGEFMERREYLERVSRCGVFLAPREKEGIGMAFLEAMAMGKCVVANRDATMDEYIEDGANGILFDLRDPRPVEPAAAARAADGAAKAAHRLRARWIADAAKINPFIAGLAPCRPSFAARAKIALSHPLYLAEGAAMRLGLRHG